MSPNKKYIKASLCIIIIFCIGLVLFFIFSAPYGDGLENTMEEGEVSESEPAYQAPLDYGDGYFSALLMGLIGFIIVIFCVLLYAKILRKRNETRDH